MDKFDFGTLDLKSFNSVLQISEMEKFVPPSIFRSFLACIFGPLRYEVGSILVLILDADSNVNGKIDEWTKLFPFWNLRDQNIIYPEKKNWFSATLQVFFGKDGPLLSCIYLTQQVDPPTHSHTKKKKYIYIYIYIYILLIVLISFWHVTRDWKKKFTNIKSKIPNLMGLS